VQTVIIALIVLASVAYLTRGLWQKKAPKNACHGDCTGCSCGK